MKNTVTNYENTLFFNGAALSGVLSVDGSYNVDYKPINVIGKGFTKQIIASVPTANLSITRYLTNNDPAFLLTGDGPGYKARVVNGGLYYLNKYFAFENGYLNSLGISCSVGEIPQIQTSFNVYGNIGPNFNPSGNNYGGGVFVPQVKNIILNCRNSSTNRITSFNIDYNTPKNSIYGLSQNNSQLPIEVHSVFPIEITSSFTLEIDDYQTKQAFADLTSAGTTNFSIAISGAVLEDVPLTTSTGNIELTVSSGTLEVLYSYLKTEDSIPIFNFSASDAIIVSEQVNSTSDDVMSVNLSYKTYIN